MTAKTTSKTEEIKVGKEFKECFIITPIGSAGSEIFNKTEGLISSVLRPVLEKFNFIPMPAHHINEAGSINKQIIQRIINSELVIANLTNINPNVMYELAIRHSFGKKVITMAENGTKLPFDIVDQRTIFYDDTMIGVEIVKPKLEIAINNILNDTETDLKISNPIYDAINQFASIQNLPQDQQDGFTLLLNKLDRMESFIGEKPTRREETFLKSRIISDDESYEVTISFDSGYDDHALNLVRDNTLTKAGVIKIGMITITTSDTNSSLTFGMQAMVNSAISSFRNSILKNDFVKDVKIIPLG